MKKTGGTEMRWICVLLVKEIEKECKQVFEDPGFSKQKLTYFCARVQDYLTFLEKVKEQIK